MTYDEQLFAKDWLGNGIHVSNTEGVYDSPKLLITTELDVNSGDYIEKTYRAGIEKKYYIPFSKKAVMDILNKSNDTLCTEDTLDVIFTHMTNSLIAVSMN